jgi:hypothetical protein
MQDECALLLPPEPVPTDPSGSEYRRLARQIRDLAHQTRLRIARDEQLRLATDYASRGDHLDRRVRPS